VLHDIITNEVIVIPACIWALAQLIKTLVALLQGKGLHPRYMFSSGGMPSSHSAYVTALATSVALTQGFGSVTFAISVALAFIVMYDSAGVRQSVSQQSIILNRIISELRLRRPVTELESDLRELVGHTPYQVVAGAALGIFVSWLWIFIATI
jgi:acid phosphatase family membrane protein YuiD